MGLEGYKIRLLCFHSPAPPLAFEYIIACEKVGEAKQWQPQNAGEDCSLLLLSAEQIEERQHSLDGLGRGYDNSGRLR